MRNMIHPMLIGLGWLPVVLLTAGCSGEPANDDGQESSEVGSLSLPLVAQANGHSYRLMGSLYVSGPTYAYLDLGPEQEVVMTSLPAGSYLASLSAVGLTRDDGSGNFVAVNARLLSPSWLDFRIFNQATSTITIEFETDGQVVTIGSGQLNVELEVGETAPLCALLGSDCGPEAWCAPPELTGSALSCISSGPVSEGEPCGSPLDCAANTSCLDFGAGAVCTALCLASEFGQPCASTGICTPQGIEYGVCAP